LWSFGKVFFPFWYVWTKKNLATLVPTYLCICTVEEQQNTDIEKDSFVRVFPLKLQPYTASGFDLTTHNSAGGDDTTRPRRQGPEQGDQIGRLFTLHRLWFENKGNSAHFGETFVGLHYGRFFHKLIWVTLAPSSNIGIHRKVASRVARFFLTQ
jgi:hypothetical protein